MTVKIGRQLWVVLHRYVGLAIAVFVAIAGLTGSVLAYIGPLREWLVPEPFAATASGVPMAFQNLGALVEATHADTRITQWPLALKSGHAATFSVQGANDPATGQPKALGLDAVWVDPVSGSILGQTSGDPGHTVAAQVLDFIYVLHYRLALPGDGARWGVWIMGIAAILWFIDCFVGAWLTLPRGRPFFVKWRPAWGVKARRLNFDLHRAGGLWFWGMLAVLALSSVQQNLNEEVLMPIARLVLPLAPDPLAQRSERDPHAPLPRQVVPELIVERAMAQASQRGWRDAPERMQRDDARGVYRVIFTTPPVEWLTATRRELFFDDTSGALLYVFQPGRGRVGDSVLDWLSALHFGTVFGWPYKLLLCVTGIVIAVLSWTGVVIWWRKRRGRAHNGLPGVDA